MKRLYISDLDGTLLNSDQKVSEFTVEKINECISNGMQFSFATARTVASALQITRKININVPCILMNGVCMYDIAEGKYIKTEYLPAEKVAAIASVLDSSGQNGFMYKISDNKLLCEYTKLDNPEMREFYNVRRERYDKPFSKIDKFSKSCDNDVIYFTLLDTFQKLSKIKDGIEKIGGIKYEFYSDIYSENVYYLEIFSGNASKLNGVNFLRKYGNFDEIIGFGDNLNDIPLFKAADVRFAVNNAKDELKAMADFIVPSNIENGPAKWLSENYIQNERKL